MSEYVDFYNLIAQERGVPAGWEWFELHGAHGGMLVKGAVCTARYRSGPRKGEKNWAKRDRSTELQIVISDEQMRERRERWEAETGRCVTCLGAGAAFAGWSATEGRRTTPCRRCAATGRAPARSEEARL